MSSLVGGGSSPKMPVVKAGNPKRTAEPVKQVSEQAKKNKQLAASLLTANWMDEPKLAKKGLLGVGGSIK